MAKRKNQQCQQAQSVTIPTQCPKCGSDQRSAYHHVQILGPGVTYKVVHGIPVGTRYAQLKKKRTTCSECGQARIDEEFVFDPGSFSASRKNSRPKSAPSRVVSGGAIPGGNTVKD